jgi:diguanylate cyclase (GGDEF)-like protein
MRPARTDELDPHEVRFRLDSVQCGAWVSFVVCLSALVYIGLYADPSDRTALILLTVAALVGSFATLRLPWEQIIRSRWREPAFLAWTIADFALIGAMAAIDGGGDSPIALAFFIPLVFVGLSYPVRSVVAVGVLGIAGYVALSVAADDDGGYALLFASTLLAVALMSGWQARNHDRRRDQIAHMSRTDPLTGALNRRGFEDAANGVLAGAERFDWPVCLLLFDLNDFKTYNDSHGHAAGDERLQRFVDEMRPLLRPTDAVARVGGDEFAVLLPRSSKQQGAIVVDRIAVSLGPEIPHCCGLSCAPDDGAELETLYQRADEELYRRKAERKARDAAALQAA